MAEKQKVLVAYTFSKADQKVLEFVAFSSFSQFIDPSTALKPRSEERGKKSRSGLTPC
ncbi:MAG: hypothetical protein V1758_04255 [Pseudomonadota bacterium]